MLDARCDGGETKILHTGHRISVEGVRSTKHAVHAGEHHTRDATTSSLSRVTRPPAPRSRLVHVHKPRLEGVTVCRRAPLGDSSGVVRDEGRQEGVARGEDDYHIARLVGLVLEAPSVERCEPRSRRGVRLAQPPSLCVLLACRRRHSSCRSTILSCVCCDMTSCRFTFTTSRRRQHACCRCRHNEPTPRWFTAGFTAGFYSRGAPGSRGRGRRRGAGRVAVLFLHGGCPAHGA